MSKSQVKKLLAGMSKEEVVNVVMELYDARKEAREYLDYYANPNESNELETMKPATHSANLSHSNTTTRWTKRTLWAKRNTTPCIQASNTETVFSIWQLTHDNN